MKRKTILITGGSGFIGSNLVEHFISKGFRVINIDKFSYASTADRFKSFFKNKNYVFIKNNVANYVKLMTIFKKYKPSVIFNLASETHVDRSIDDPFEFINNNLNISLILSLILRELKLKYNKKFKFIQISTDEVYGTNNGKSSVENSRYDPRSPYAASKAASDHIFKSFNYTYGIPLIIVNCCNNYGPFQFPEKFIPTIILNLKKNKPVPLYGKGKNIREWIHVKDYCNALEIIMKKGIDGENYNVGTGKRLDNKKMIMLIYKEMNKLIKIKFNKSNCYKLVKDRPGHDKRYAINSNKLRNKLKWKPNIDLKSGIKETISWYLNNNKWLKYCYNKYKGERLGLR
mgnify:CR=1 FL=1